MWLPKETAMNTFDVQGIEIRASRDRVFEFLRDPRNLIGMSQVPLIWAVPHRQSACLQLRAPGAV